MKGKIFRVLAAILCAATVAQSIPVFAYSNDSDVIDSEFSEGSASSDYEAAISNEPETQEQSVSYILGEVEDERTENTKVFRMSDGSYTAAVYPVQVHYEKDGEMREIDYSFEAVERDGDAFYETKEGPVTIRVPKVMDEGAAVTYIAGDNEISFALNTDRRVGAEYAKAAKQDERINALKEVIAKELSAGESAAAKLSQAEADMSAQEAAEELTDIMMRADNALSAVQYATVKKGVDLSYSIAGSLLKEEIILNNANAESKSFTFDLAPGNLTPVLNDDGSVSLNDEEGNEQLTIAAPFMYDAAGAESTDIKVTLEEGKAGSYTYTLVPDEEWLSDDDRSYPVVIDPPITDSSFSTVKDTTAVFSSAAGSLNSTGEVAYLKVGRRYDNVTGTTPEVQAMLYSPLPSVLDSTTSIVHAYINLYGYRQSISTCPKDMQINAYTITSDWNTSNINENSVLCLGSNGRADYSNVLDYVYYNDTSSTDGKLYTFEITEAAQKWLNGAATNYGVALRAVGLGSEDCFARFFDSTNRQTSQACPKFVYVYRDSKGIEDYWSFTSLKAGRTGVLSVNNYNGNLVTVHDLVSSTGNNMPVSVSLIYSANSADIYNSAEIGMWRTNYHMKVTPCDLSFYDVKYKYCYIDSDGTRHYLKQDGTSHRDEDGLGLTLTDHTSEFNTVGYRYSIETKDHTQYQFDYFGRLSKVVDPNGNYNRVYYRSNSDSSDNRIDSIVEGSNMTTATRKTTFTYQSNGDVVITSPEGNHVRLDFVSSANKMLCGIEYEDGKYSEFQFTAIGSAYYPVKINDGNGHGTVITYGTGRKVSSISYASSAETQQKYTFTYSHNSTKVTDIKGRASTLQFNGFGQTISTVDHTSSIGQSYKFGAPGGNNDGYENKLLLSSKAIYATENRVDSGSFNAAALVNKFQISPESGSGLTKSFEWSNGNTGVGRMKLTRASGSTGDVSVYQSVKGLTTGKYTLSAYVNTEGGTLEGEGVYVVANVFHGSYRTGNRSTKVRYTKQGEWVRLQTTVDIISGDTSINVGISFSEGSWGTVYVDDIQLEHSAGGGAGSFNQLHNSSLLMTNGEISGWGGGTSKFTVAAKDGSAPSGLKYVASATGAASRTTNLSQRIYLAGKKDDPLIMGAWAKGNSVPISDNHDNKKGAPKFTLLLTFFDGTTKVGETHTVNFNSGTEDWQFVSDKVIAPGNFTNIVFTFSYDYNEGKISLGTPFVYKESYGQSYVYDSNGNVTSSTDAAETEATFAYQDNVLTTSINPTGSRYMYATNDKTYNTDYAVTNGGQKIGISYNASGDATRMLIQDMKFLGEVPDGKNVYIVNAKTGRALTAYSMGEGATVHSANLYLGETRSTWEINHLSGTVYYLKSAGDTAKGFSASATVSGGATAKLKTITRNSAWVPAPEFKFGFTSNGDGTFRISTSSSNNTKYLYENGDHTHYKGSGCTHLYIGEYDDAKPEYKWYVVSAADSGTKKMQTTAQYSADGNYLVSSTDAAGGVTGHKYGANGLVSETKDPNGGTTNYSYDSMRRTTQVKSGTSQVNYTYDKDLLKQISVDEGALLYNFEYDSLGRKTAVKVGNSSGSRTLASYTYSNKLLTRQNYGNGTEYISFEYDNLDRVKKKSYNGDSSKSVEYFFNPGGDLYHVKDSIGGQRTFYEYDLSGRINGIAVTELNGLKMKAYESVRYNDKKGTVKSTTRTMYGSDGSILNTLPYTYTYGEASKCEMPGVLYGYTAGSMKVANTYDSLGRLQTKSVKNGESTVGNESYTYMSNPTDSSYTTTRVNSMTDLTGNAHTYTYDANGNILSDTYNGKTVEYRYDSQNRMTVYRDEKLGFSYEYVYDNRGNITELREYNYTDAELANPRRTYSYGYADATWADLLTSFDGKTIPYDELGNPTEWIWGDELEWENRRLVSGYGTEYKYNADGLRLSKSSTDRSTEYYVVDGTYIGEVTKIGSSTYVIAYIYGSSGIAGINVNGTPYYFAKNLQGDVTAILDAAGNIVGTYEYEAYGAPIQVHDENGQPIMYDGTRATHIANINPFRYRGYMFDTESDLYYLNSRYYDPFVGRFLNADALVSTGQGLDGNNMFAYCNNNPIVLKDPSGNRSVEAIQADINYIEERIAYARSVIVNGPNPYHYNAKTICTLKHWLKDLQAELEAEKNRKAHPLGGSVVGETYDGHQENARDFGADEGAPIYAAMGGTVTEVVMKYGNEFYSGPTGKMNEYGNYIIITTWDETRIIYAHQQQSNYVKKDDIVSAGQQIGDVGHTGYCDPSDYSHLHFQTLTPGSKVDDYYLH